MEALRHLLNPIHVYCRLVDWGVSCSWARALCRVWGWIVWPALYGLPLLLHRCRHGFGSATAAEPEPGLTRVEALEKAMVEADGDGEVWVHRDIPGEHVIGPCCWCEPFLVCVDDLRSPGRIVAHMEREERRQ